MTPRPVASGPSDSDGTTLPVQIVAHCDWGRDPRKRVTCAAFLHGTAGGRPVWQLGLPEPVGACTTLPARLRAQCPEHSGASVLIGVDFPIGLPRAYRAISGFDSFRDALAAFGRGPWAQWFEVCNTPEEIGPRRPFYPARPGGTSRAQLLAGLGLDDPRALMRLCDAATDLRGAGGTLFWTMGSNQVGKAAISAWRDWLQPCPDLALWPFDGGLAALCRPGSTVLAEAYPGEIYGWLGIHRQPAWSKRRQDGRRMQAQTLLAHAERRGHHLPDVLRMMILDGFGPQPAGEDAFDALVGVLGMLEIVTGHRPENLPRPGDPAPCLRDAQVLSQWEGWVLGLDATRLTGARPDRI